MITKVNWNRRWEQLNIIFGIYQYKYLYFIVILITIYYFACGIRIAEQNVILIKYSLQQIFSRALNVWSRDFFIFFLFWCCYVVLVCSLYIDIKGICILLVDVNQSLEWECISALIVFIKFAFCSDFLLLTECGAVSELQI